MKKQILDSLKAKFSGVSEAILNRIADKLAKTVTTVEDVTTAVEGVTFQQVLESYGDSRATEAQQSAVTNYEKKHGLKDGKKIETGGGGTPNPDEKGGNGGGNEDLASQIAAAVNAALKPLNDKLAAMEGEKTANSRKSALDKILDGAPETIRQRYEKDFGRMNFKDDEDFNGWIGEIKPDIDNIKNEFETKGGKVSRPRGGAAGGSGGSGGSDENPYIKARIQAREAEKTAPAIVGLQTEIK